MTVFVCHNMQGKGYKAVCGTLEKAKKWVEDSITAHQNNQDDPNPWEGWHWYVKNGVYCFGGTEESFLKDYPDCKFIECAEATVQEFEVL